MKTKIKSNNGKCYLVTKSSSSKANSRSNTVRYICVDSDQRTPTQLHTAYYVEKGSK